MIRTLTPARPAAGPAVAPVHTTPASPACDAFQPLNIYSFQNYVTLRHERTLARSPDGAVHHASVVDPVARIHRSRIMTQQINDRFTSAARDQPANVICTDHYVPIYSSDLKIPLPDLKKRPSHRPLTYVVLSYDR